MKFTAPPPVWPPRNASTGHGGLPHSDIRLACEYVSSHYPAAPFVPELPRCGDLPLQARAFLAEHIRAFESTHVVLTLDFAAVTTWFQSVPSTALFPDLEARVAALGPTAPVAVHLPGPLTLLGSAVGVEGICLWDVLPLRPLGAEALGRVAGEVAQRLVAAGVTPLIVLDEPLAARLDAANPANLYLLEAALAPARSAGARVGMHWCCPPPLDVLQNVDLDYASLDVVRFGDVARQRSRTLSRWLARDRVLVVGILDAADIASDAYAKDRLRALSLPPESAILVAPTCGTSQFSVERELDVAQKLKHLAQSIKELR